MSIPGAPLSVTEQYVRWLRMSAAAIKSDGCTLADDLYRDCCYEHDLAYHFEKDPRAAFRVGWDAAPKMTRRDADIRFKECMQSHSRLGKWNPVSWWRYAAVRVGGWWAWRKHREASNAATEARAEIMVEIKEEAKDDAT